MSHIETVLGPIHPEELGVTMMHEHLIWDQSFYQKPIAEDSQEGMFLNSKIVPENMHKIRIYNLHAHRQNGKQTNKEEAVAETLHLKNAGGNALVDCSCLGISRDPMIEQYVSQKTGLHVIMSTGLYSRGSCPEVETLSCEEKKALYIKELTEGVDGTGIKAGVIGELGVSDYSKYEQETLVAAGQAQAETGAAILIHQPGLRKIGHEILDIIEENGGMIRKTVLCHCDPLCDDIPYLESLMRRGVNLSFDQFGLESYLGPDMSNIWLPRDIDRIRAIARLCELGYSRQVVLSQDLCFQICYKRYGGGGYSHVLENIIPVMRSIGVTEKAVHHMLVSNPARILTID